MLAKLRLTSQLYGRTLLGMLLFVWLSMAISPCVMANDINLDNPADRVSLHADMEDCSFCPSQNSHSAVMDLCKITHSHFSDTITFNIDSIDVDSFVCFEIPVVSPLLPDVTHELVHSDHYTDSHTLSPLSLTGMLRI